MDWKGFWGLGLLGIVAADCPARLSSGEDAYFRLAAEPLPPQATMLVSAPAAPPDRLPSALGLGEGKDVIKGPDGGTAGQPLVIESLTLPTAEPPLASSALDQELEPRSPLAGHVRAGYLVGNLPGQEGSFGSVAIFRPWMLEDGLIFVDSQVTIDNYSKVGAHVGGGRRWYNEQTDRVFGVHTFCDLDTTPAGNTFPQISGGHSTDGARAGVSGWLTNNLLVQMGLTGDPLFGANLYGALTVFYGGRRGLLPENVFEKMRLPIDRQSRETIARQTEVVKNHR